MTTSRFEGSATIPFLIRHAAEKFPDREFIITPSRQITFGDTELQSRRLAQHLLRSGIGKGSRVGILFPQGPDFVVAFLAITRIGAIAVPLSTFLKAPELRQAVRHADIGLLIAPRTLLGSDTEEMFESLWPELGSAADADLELGDAPYLRQIWVCGGAAPRWAVGLPDVAELGDEPASADELLLAVEAQIVPSDLMVFVYTSGATAEPKVVVHTQGGQIRHAWTLAQIYGLDHDARTFTNMPFFWVGGLTVVVLSHLHVGAAVITVERMDSTEMLDLIEATRPKRVLGWTLYERLSADPSFPHRDLGGIEFPIPDLLAAGLRHNSLGMSETGGPHTGVVVATNKVDLPEKLRGSFGPPLAGIHHKIVDLATGQEVEAGVEGQICVRGDNLMDGLYKKDRHDTFDADGWYHTGDKGFFSDGLLFFTGRLTEMIKTGGANVAPREVELAVESLPGVKAAFVVGIPDPERGELVSCLVCPEPGHDIDAASLSAALRDQIASYKIPRKIVVVPYDDAPWLPSGKVSKPRIVELLTNARA